MRLIDADDIPYVDLNGDTPASDVRVWVAFKDRIDSMPTIGISTVEKPKDISEGVHRYIEGKEDWTRIDVKKVLRASMWNINVYEISEQIALGSLADWCYTLKSRLASVLAQLMEDEGIE